MQFWQKTEIRNLKWVPFVDELLTVQNRLCLVHVSISMDYRQGMSVISMDSIR